MPMEQGKSSLSSLLGAAGQKAHDTHKGDDTRWGIINLPAGINGGVAQLVKAGWALYGQGTKNAGKPYVRFEGRAILPEVHNGAPVAGLMVSQIIPLCDQPDRTVKVSDKVTRKRTLDDNYNDLLNELRKLGVETNNLPFGAIESRLAGLQKVQPYFRFSTRGWTPPKTPANPNPTEMVFTQFEGVCDAPKTVSTDPAAHFTDKSAAVPTFSEEPTQEPTEAFSSPPPRSPSAVATAAEPDDGDLDALAVAAGSDETAQTRLKELAMEAGVAESDVDNAPSWDAVVDMIRMVIPGEGAPVDEGAAPAPDEEWEPVAGDVYFYRPVNPKTKRPVDKAVECEVTTVDTKAKTVTLKNIDNPKLSYMKVKWDDLQVAGQE